MRHAATFLLAALVLLSGRFAGAQDTDTSPDTGRLRFVVRDAEGDTPVTRAVIFLDDPTGAEFRRALYTAPDGTVTTGPLAPHLWRFTVLHPRYKKAVGQVSAPPGATLTVAFVSGRTTASERRTGSHATR